MFLPILLVAARLAVVVRVGLRDRAFRAMTILLVFWIGVGTACYSLLEHWDIIDALYFSVVTLTTIGYGDFSPETDSGKLFTVFFAPTGIGVFVAFSARIAQIVLSKRVDQDREPDV